MATKKPKIVRVQIRFPRDIHRMLAETAKLERISMNAVVIRAVEVTTRLTIQKHNQPLLFAEGNQ